jgi:hypothetical protein
MRCETRRHGNREEFDWVTFGEAVRELE